MTTTGDDTPSVRDQIVRNQEVIDGLNARLARKTDEVKIIQQVSAQLTSTLDLETILFSDLERAALAFAEMFVNDPHAITDEDTRAVVKELGDEGMVAFVEALALFDGFARFRVMLGVEAEGDAALEIDSPRVGDASLV